MRAQRLVTAFVLAAVCVAGAAFGAGKKKSVDQFWTRPDYATLGVDKIALIPVTSLDHNIQNENQVEATIGPIFKTIPYNWVSGSATRDILRAHSGSDSLLKVLQGQIIAGGRIDSLQAPSVAAMLRCDALLSIREDEFERHDLESGVAGKPYTRVRLTAALVDSIGRLLWTASGSETAEGSYFDPASNPGDLRDIGIEHKTSSAQTAAPAPREALTVLFTRWKPEFPPRATAADSSAKH